MILTTQVTKDYYEKCGDLFASLQKNWKDDVLIGCIDFKPQDCPFPWFYIDSTRCIYNGYNPKNRDKYISLQHGEFMEFQNVIRKHDLVLNIDADMVLQESIDWKEINIGSLDPYTILATYSSFPSPSLIEVSNRKVFGKKPGIDLKIPDEKEFCGAFMLTTGTGFHMLNKFFKWNFDFVKRFDHHASGQLLINKIAHTSFNVEILPDHFHNADWFSGTRAVKNDDGYLMVGDKKVNFIHTKFNGEWKW